MQVPEILPPDQQLEHQIDEAYFMVADEMADIYEEYATFSDDNFGAQHLGEMTKITDVIAHSYMNGEVLSDDLYRAIYEAYFFAYSVAFALRVGPSVGVAVSDYYDQPVEELFDTMHSDAEEYLAERQAVNGMIDAFLNNIDPSGRYPEVVRAVAGVTFKQIEEAERQCYIDRQVDEFMQALDIDIDS